MNLRIPVVTIFAALVPALIVVAPAVAQSESTPTPEQILSDAALFGEFQSLEMRFTMEIHERRGTKDRGMAAYIEQSGDSYRALLQIVSPAFLNRMKFLTVTEDDRRNQWLATSSGVRRVADSNRNDRLFDSDFTVEDLSDYDPEDYRLRLMPDARVGGTESYVLEAIPVSGDSDYARKVLYVAKESRLLLRADFFNESGELVRQFEQLEQMSLQGRPFPRQVKMSTLSAGTHTVLTVQEAISGQDIPDRLFNRGSL
jgi:hypothetical protein